MNENDLRLYQTAVFSVGAVFFRLYSSPSSTNSSCFSSGAMSFSNPAVIGESDPMVRQAIRSGGMAVLPPANYGDAAGLLPPPRLSVLNACNLLVFRFPPLTVPSAAIPLS